MTVPSTINRNDYLSDGVTTAFPVTFRFLDNAHLQVIESIVATGAETTLVLNSGYSVTGAGANSGGTVTITPARATGSKFSILRNVPSTQLTDYIANDPFPAETHEAALDKLTMLVGQHDEVLTRALSLRAGDAVGSGKFDARGASIMSLADGTASNDAASYGQLLTSILTAIANPNNVLFIQDGTGAVARTLMGKLKELKTPGDYSAVFDGVTDASVQLQTALDTGFTIMFPPTASPAVAKNLTPVNGQTLIFSGGRYLPALIGDGVNPIFKVGDGTGTVRKISIFGANLSNSGAKCIYANNAPNFTLENSKLVSSGANALDMTGSYRCRVVNNDITTSGAFYAISAHLNMNGMTIENNVVSGGTSGSAIVVEQSQGVIINGNIIESSLNGIWVSSTSDTDKGNCNGVIIQGNYIEQSSTPLKLGVVSSIAGLTCTGNYVGNTNTNIVSARTASIWWGRIIGGTIKNNALHIASAVTEDFYRAELITGFTTGSCTKLTVADNYEVNAPLTTATALIPNGGFTFSGALAATASTQRTWAGDGNYFDFLVGGTGAKKQVWLSPTFTANVAVATTGYIPIGLLAYGGRVVSVEVIDSIGTMTGCLVKIGRTSSTQETVAAVDISTLTYAAGRAPMTLATGSATLHGEEANTYTVTAGAGTGTFRIRIVYQAN